MTKVPGDEGRSHHSHRGHHSRIKVYLIAAVLLVIFLPSFVKYQELSYKSRKLEARIAELTAENRHLAEEKIRLETDITYIEKRARESIGVARKGEIVVKSAPGKK
jgi:cell division protein FtsB